MRFFEALAVASVAVVPVFASSPYRNGVFRRDVGTCNIKLATSAGGRKVGIVIDSSGSMEDNDPNNLRIQAGKALNAQLGTGPSPDLVTVVDFDDSATVIYPLGAPSGASGSFDSIDSTGGTFIADGIAKAVAELTKPGNDPTKDRSGIVVLTDGEDSSRTRLISEITNAGSLGIRVSFGFLAPPDSFSNTALQEAILKTGGTYMSFDTAEIIQSWLFLLLSNGLTATDHASTTDQPLLSGITIAKLSGTNPVSFSYAAQAGEKLVFTVESQSKQALGADLQDGSGNSVGKNSTTDKAPAVITYEATGQTDLKLVVAATNSTAEGVFQVSLNSSLGISGCSLNTSVGTNSTKPPGTPKPPPVTAGVTQLTATVGFSAIGVFLATILL